MSRELTVTATGQMALLGIVDPTSLPGFSGLVAWRSDHEPGVAERRALPALTEALARSLEKADDATLLREMDRLIGAFEAFGVKALDRQAVAGIYDQTLGKLPADLLHVAIDRAIQSHAFHTMPKPAEILKHVSEEWSRRRIGSVQAYLMARACRERGLDVGPDARSPEDAPRDRTLPAGLQAELDRILKRRPKRMPDAAPAEVAPASADEIEEWRRGAR